MTKRFELIFLDSTGRNVRISMANPNEELQSEDVKSVMDQIILLNVFAPGGYDLVQASGARIVTTSVQAFSVQ